MMGVGRRCVAYARAVVAEANPAGIGCEAQRKSTVNGSDPVPHTVMSSDAKVVYVVGARPNFIKMAPVISEMRRRAPWLGHIVLHTGQHYDREMSDIFFEDLGLPEADHLLGVGSGRHGAQTGLALKRVEEILIELRPRLVLVPGDVNSTLAAALAAVKLQIDVAHLEAGLRSFDRSMPEEINRLLVDQVSRWCFTHSPEAAFNLRAEGIAEDKVFFVGNTMIDSLVKMRPRIESSNIHRRIGIEGDEYLLVTLHRPALVDAPIFELVLEELHRIALKLPVVFPMHPRTRARVPPATLRTPGLHVIEPTGYVDFLALEQSAKGVLTDSGGVQEETTFLGVPCFTLRDNTERPVTITQGTNHIIGLSPAAIAQIPGWLGQPLDVTDAIEGWDGHAARRVADVLVQTLVGPFAVAEARRKRSMPVVAH